MRLEVVIDHTLFHGGGFFFFRVSFDFGLGGGGVFEVFLFVGVLVEVVELEDIVESLGEVS